MTDNRIALFETEKLSRAVMKLSVPTVLSSLVMIIYSLADTFFVGMLNDSVQNAAVTLSAPVLLAFNAVNNLFGVGSSSMISRALGRKEYDVSYKSSSFGFYCALFAGVIFGLLCLVFNDQLLLMVGSDSVTYYPTKAYIKWTVIYGASPAILNVVLSYMIRAEGSALHASIGTMSGCVLNIILDPLFVLPQFLGMGAEGAALATFISNTFAVFYFLVLLYVRRKTTYVSINPKYFVFSKAIVIGVCAVGIPASIQNLLNVTGMTILNNFTSSYGSDAVAAMGIAQRLNNVPVSIAMGFSQGVMPLIGYCFASGNYKRMKDAIFFTGKIVAIALAIVSGIYFLFAPAFVAIFMSKTIIVDYGAMFLRGFCLGIPFLCIDFLAVGVFQAVGAGRYSLAFAIMRKLILEIPAILILNKLFPLYGIPYSQFASEIIMATLAIVFLLRMIKRLSRT